MMNTVAQMKALGDPNRFRISMMLLHRPLCVCELLEVLDIAGGTLSNHLKILKEAKIIDQRKDGKWVEYFLSGKDSDELINLLKKRVNDSKQLDADAAIIQSINRTICSTKKKNPPLKAFKSL